MIIYLKTKGVNTMSANTLIIIWKLLDAFKIVGTILVLIVSIFSAQKYKDIKKLTNDYFLTNYYVVSNYKHVVFSIFVV